MYRHLQPFEPSLGPALAALTVASLNTALPVKTLSQARIPQPQATVPWIAPSTCHLAAVTDLSSIVVQFFCLYLSVVCSQPVVSSHPFFAANCRLQRPGHRLRPPVVRCHLSSLAIRHPSRHYRPLPRRNWPPSSSTSIRCCCLSIPSSRSIQT